MLNPAQCPVSILTRFETLLTGHFTTLHLLYCTYSNYIPGNVVGGGGARRRDDVLLAKVEVPGPVATPDPLHGADLFTKIL